MTRSELLGADLHLILSLRVRGRIYRVADVEMTIPNTSDSEQPNLLAYGAGLEVEDLPAAAELGAEGVQEARSASCTLSLPDPETWEALTASTLGFGRATAEISIYRSGDDYGDRVILLDGRIDQVLYGDAFEPISFEITDEASTEDRTLIPDPALAATSALWPRASSTGVSFPADTSDGMVYPEVWGAPGLVRSDDDFDTAYGWPGILVEVDSTTGDNFSAGAVDAVVLCMGHLGTAMETGGVRLTNRTSGSYVTVTPTATQDKAGNAVLIATIAGADLVITSGDELWFSSISEARGGWARETSKTTCARGAGEIIRRLLLRSTLRIDIAGSEAAFQVLDGYLLDFYLDDPTRTVIDVVGELLENLPAAIVPTEAGYRIVAWPASATAETVIATIDPRIAGERSSDVSVGSSAELYTDLILDYAYDVAEGVARRRVWFSPQAEVGATEHPSCRRAWAALGGKDSDRRTLTLSSEVIWDPGSASAVLGILARRAAYQPLRVAYLLPQEYGAIEPGQAVLVNDEDVNISDRVSWGVSITKSTGDVEIVIETLPTED